MAVELEDEIASIIRAYAEGRRPPGGSNYAAKEVIVTFQYRGWTKRKEKETNDEAKSVPAG